MMKNPKRYKVLQEVTIEGTTYSAGVEVRLESSVGDPLVEAGSLEAITN